MPIRGTTPDQPIRSDPIDRRHPAPDIERVYDVFVNAYFVDAPGASWVLIDSGLPRNASLIRRRAESRYGPGTRPIAIILTHGHFDHAGNTLALAREWRVPVFAHSLELPYLTGRSDYPPHDPTVGGALGFMSRAFPDAGIDLGTYVHALPPDSSVPGLDEWQWMHTPGHSHGHISLFRERDRFLIAGDALATVNQDSPLSMFNLRPEFSVPPAPFTTDWPAGFTSVEELAALRPRTVVAGHGAPITGPRVADDLARFVDVFRIPRGGRYSQFAAIADERGVVWVPPPIPDPLPKQLLLAGVLAGGVYLVHRSRARGRMSSDA